MLAVAALAALSFTPPPTNVGTRRDLLASAFSAAAFAPSPRRFRQLGARAGLCAALRVGSQVVQGGTESYKQFQLSQPKAESEAFKEAEKRCKAFESGGSKGPESVADDGATRPLDLFQQRVSWLHLRLNRR